jgi:phosphatidyl-myo-inositol dimannoside synthase
VSAPLRLCVVSETRFVRAPDGRVWAPAGVDGYAFWQRYLDVFDRVLVAARTAPGVPGGTAVAVDGPGVRVTPLPPYRGALGFWRARTDVRRRLADAVAEADALCVRAPGPLADVAAGLAADRPLGVEVVGDPWDALGPGTVRSAVRPLVRRLLAQRLRALCARATAVAYVTAGSLQERYPTASWSTVYSSIDLGDDAFAPDALLRRRAVRLGTPGRGAATSPWGLAFVGTLSQRYKGLDVLLTALARLRTRGWHATLDVVGDGRHRAELEAQARALNVPARFHGQVPSGSGVRALLDAADAFVLPSRCEGLPRVVIEAMARGLPCIATRIGGTPELLDADDLVPPGDAAALATALRRLLGRDPLSLARLVRTHRERAWSYHRDALRPRRRAFYGQLLAAALQRRGGAPVLRLAPREVGS